MSRIFLNSTDEMRSYLCCLRVARREWQFDLSATCREIWTGGPGSIVMPRRWREGAFLLAVLMLLCSSRAFARPLTVPIPNINEASPASIVPGSADFTLTVNGSNFIPVSIVQWNATALVTTYIGRNRLIAVAPAALVATAGSGWITIVNPGGGPSNRAFVSVTSSTPSLAFLQSDITMNGSDMAVALGDFNGDGKLDIVAGSHTGTTISVLLGNGDGTYKPAITSTSPGQSGIAVGDFNRDGNLDVAIVSYPQSTVSILLGNGDGTFQAAQTYPIPTYAYTLAVGDFNGDGKLDVAVANEGGGSVISVLLGNGDGTLQGAVNYATGIDPYGIVVADFNGDGKLDLAVSNHGSAGTISVLLGNGDGTFQTQTTYTVGTGPLGLAVGDFNKDGKADLAVTSQSAGSISILLGNGDGTFQPSTTYGTFPTAFSVAIGDLNGDGNLDLAISGSNAKAISILLGNGDGTFQTQQTFGTGSFGWTVAMGDLDGSGRLGLATADYSSSKIRVLLQGVVLTPSSLTFASQGVGTTSAAQTETVTNATGSAVTISGIAFTGANSSDFGESDNCVNVALASSATCTIQVTFAPSVTGAETATLNVTDNAHGSPQTASLNGTGAAAPVATLAPTGLIFASQTLGSSSAVQAVTLTNTGSAILSSISITVTGTNSADFGQTNNCTATLATGASCTISVTFTPSLVGTESASLSIAENASGSPQTALLSGTGVQITPTISWATPAAITYSTALSVTQLNATSGVSGSFVYTPASGMVLGAGSQVLTVKFTPTDVVTYAVATAHVTLVVSPAVTTTVASLSSSSASPGVSVTLTATVSSSAGVPAGSVSFLDGTTTLATATLSSGVAVYTTSTLVVGTHSITAVYPVNGNFLGSSSSSVTETIITPTFTVVSVSGSGATPVTITSGQTAQFQMTLTGVGGFTGQTTFSVSGLPSNATSTFNPPILTIGAIPAIEMLSVTTTPRFPYLSEHGPARPTHPLATTIFPFAVLALAGLGLTASRRRKWQTSFALLALFVASGVLAGCGNSGNFQNTGTPAGTYPLVVTATSGTTQKSITVMLIVQ